MKKIKEFFITKDFYHFLGIIFWGFFFKNFTLDKDKKTNLIFARTPLLKVVYKCALFLKRENTNRAKRHKIKKQIRRNLSGLLFYFEGHRNTFLSGQNVNFGVCH